MTEFKEGDKARVRVTIPRKTGSDYATAGEVLVLNKVSNLYCKGTGEFLNVAAAPNKRYLYLYLYEIKPYEDKNLMTVQQKRELL